MLGRASARGHLSRRAVFRRGESTSGSGRSSRGGMTGATRPRSVQIWALELGALGRNPCRVVDNHTRIFVWRRRSHTRSRLRRMTAMRGGFCILPRWRVSVHCRLGQRMSAVRTSIGSGLPMTIGIVVSGIVAEPRQEVAIIHAIQRWTISTWSKLVNGSQAIRQFCG